MQELQKGGVVTSPDGTKVSKGPFNPPFNVGNPLAGNAITIVQFSDLYEQFMIIVCCKVFES